MLLRGKPEVSLLRIRRLKPTIDLHRSFHSSRRSPCPSTSTPPTPKLRFAPSPTGFLHLGGLRTALYNHLLARKLGGKWVLRIEDTDQTRYVEGAVESLLRTLKWAQLDFDEGPGKEHKGQGPYFQSERAHVYDRYLEPLLASGKAYHCFCSPERLAQTRKLLQKQQSKTVSGYDRKCLGLSREEVRDKLEKGQPSIVRFKSSSSRVVQKDLIYDTITYDSLPIEDFVLRKSDGLPTYHFANVVDDHEMGVTHVLRGEEWLPSTPKHLQLYSALGLTPPQFAHLPLLVNPDGSKLSKRTGDVKVEDYIDKGYESSALLNFIALLGWSPQSSASGFTPSSSLSSPRSSTKTSTSNERTAHEPEKESDNSQASDLLSMSQLIEQFSLEAINKNRPTLQQGKLDWLNRNHIKMKLFDSVGTGDPEADTSRKDLALRLRNVVEKELKVEGQTTLDEEYLLAVVDALKDRLHTINDIPTLGRYFFVEPDYDSIDAKKLYKSSIKDSKLYRETLSAAIPIVASLPERLFSRQLSLVETPSIEQQLLVTLSSISIVTPSPASSPPTTTNRGTETPRTGGGLVVVDNRQKATQVMSPLRHCLTGQKVGSSIAATVRVLGRDKTRRRLERAIEWSLKQEPIELKKF